MQIDFHHGVIYVLARLARFTHPDAAVLAYASQYVDDATNRGTILFDNGRRYAHLASAHEVFDLNQNCNVKEDCEVWVPFHFLPGNNGAGADGALRAPVNQRLLCTRDSQIAAGMCHACLQARSEPGSLHRLGITAHTYADTWAHRGFEGIRNSINAASNVEHQGYQALKDQIIAALVGGIIKLGHAALQTNPDLPFLKFSYKDSSGTTVVRDNPTDFMVACRRIFELFGYYQGTFVSTIPPADEELLRDSLAGFDDLDGGVRHNKWLQLIASGQFSFGAPSEKELADLNYAAKGPGSWKHAALGTTKAEDSPDDIFPYQPSFESSNWKLFHDALKEHHFVILETILPQYQLPLTPELVRAAGA